MVPSSPFNYCDRLRAQFRNLAARVGTAQAKGSSRSYGFWVVALTPLPMASPHRTRTTPTSSLLTDRDNKNQQSRIRRPGVREYHIADSTEPCGEQMCFHSTDIY